MSNIYNEENCKIYYEIIIQSMDLYHCPINKKSMYQIIGHTLHGTRLPNTFTAPAELFDGLELPLERKTMAVIVDDNFNCIITDIANY